MPQKTYAEGIESVNAVNAFFLAYGGMQGVDCQTVPSASAQRQGNGCNTFLPRFSIWQIEEAR